MNVLDFEEDGASSFLSLVPPPLGGEDGPVDEEAGKLPPDKAFAILRRELVARASPSPLGAVKMGCQAEEPGLPPDKAFRLFPGN
jgi:hypothetical protein